MWSLWFNGVFYTDCVGEWEALRVAKAAAKEMGCVCKVVEEDGDDEEEDDEEGTHRWNVHPDGTEDPVYLGSKQFA